MKSDLFFMSQAYAQAKKAFDVCEVPIGAVLVDEHGTIVARGYNQVEKKGTQLAHAELQVLARAAKKIGNWRLNSMTLYVTVQPCMMCLGALYVSRVSRVVYGVESPKYGATMDMFVSGQSSGQIGTIYQNLHTSLQYIHYEPAKLLLQMFFQKKKE